MGTQSGVPELSTQTSETTPWKTLVVQPPRGRSTFSPASTSPGLPGARKGWRVALTGGRRGCGRMQCTAGMRALAGARNPAPRAGAGSGGAATSPVLLPLPGMGRNPSGTPSSWALPGHSHGTPGAKAGLACAQGGQLLQRSSKMAAGGKEGGGPAWHTSGWRGVCGPVWARIAGHKDEIEVG